jgi:asparagine synthase (glutamine-hydrolysing)
MSGITGIYFLDQRYVTSEQISRMTDTLEHRGPDGRDVWFDHSTGLGHRMLFTTPESLHEQLPLVVDQGSLVITADARIDNRDELISALGIDLRSGQTITDSALILVAYQTWGQRCPEYLLGDFVFAIWDQRNRTLFMARDHFGVKPIYYYRSPRLFAFASEIKALLTLEEVPHKLNEVRVGDYLVPLFEDKEITFYEEILRLPPASCMTISLEGIRQWVYWSLDPSNDIRLHSDEEYAEAFREIFTEAVRCRLRSAYPIGSLLSGGLDSSSIACTARKLIDQNGSQPLHTFSAIFDDVPECDEREFIHAVLDQGGCEPHFLHADQLSPLTDYKRMFWHQDEAFYAPNLFINWGLFGEAKQQGIRVIFDGIDGDTIVSHGFTRLTELMRAGRWIALYKEVRALSKNFNSPYWRILRRFGFKPLMPNFVRLAWRVLRRQDDPNPSIRRDFAECISLDERIKKQKNNDLQPPQKEKEAHYRSITRGIHQFAFELADRTSAAFNLEVRYPFFDRRVVDFCLALPSKQKLYQGWSRMILRRSMEGILPEMVRWRGGKSNLSANFSRGLRFDNKNYLDRVIVGEQSKIFEYIDTDVLRGIYQQYLSDPKRTDEFVIWKAISLALWLDHSGFT